MTKWFAFILLLALQSNADTLLGKVIKLADGDTITVLDETNTQHKIRLSGIDAPEKRQAFGNVSKQSITEQVAGRSVAVEWVKVDRYGLKVGKVLLAGQDANLVPVSRGLAWHYKQYQQEPSPTDQQTYAALKSRPKPPNWVYGGIWNKFRPGNFGTRSNHNRIKDVIFPNRYLADRLPHIASL